MSNSNFDNVIIGSGIAGLTVFYYLASTTNSRNLLITNNIAGAQTSAPFPLGPRFLHSNRDTAALLQRLGFSLKTKDVFIGYKNGDEVRNFADESFKEAYAKKSRSTSKVEKSFLSGGGISSFSAFEVSQTALATSLLKSCMQIANSERNQIAIRQIKNINFNKIKTNKETFSADNIISTIPLNVLTSLVSDSSVSFKIKTKPEEVCFMLADGPKENFDYIYSVSDLWYRKSYVPEMNKWVYEIKNRDDVQALLVQFAFQGVEVTDWKFLTTQITNSLNLKEFGNIKLVGRYAQMNHSIKTEDVIQWAYKYSFKFKKEK